MPIARKSTKPAGILNEAGEPEILLEVNGLKLSLTPPATTPPTAAAPRATADPAAPPDSAGPGGPAAGDAGDAEAPSAG
jgi:hypothetical protein